MDLTELTDEPELTVAIDGRQFHFSELPIGSLAKLQGWIKANVPDPLVTLRERMKGYPESVVAQVADSARKESPAWPPEVGSSEGALALMGNTQGQVQTLWLGLQVHQPDATIEDAEKLYRILKKMRDGRLVKRIFGTIFGTAGAERDDEDQPDPKGSGEGAATPSNGSSISAQPSSASR